MKLIIDADACPVIRIALDEAVKRGIESIIVCDNSHSIEYENAATIIVDKGSDSADCKIANLCMKDDIVITQDYGLAALVLGKKAKAISQNGLIYNNANIDNLLYSRFLGKKERLAGNRTKGPKKRTQQDDTNFLNEFIKLLDD